MADVARVAMEIYHSWSIVYDVLGLLDEVQADRRTPSEVLIVMISHGRPYAEGMSTKIRACGG